MLVDGEHMVLTRERYETMLDGALSSKGGGEKLEGAMLDEPIHTRGDELDGAMPRGERYAEAQGGGSSNGSKALRSSSGSGSNSSGSSSRSSSSSSSSSSNNSNNSSSNTNARRNPAEREDLGEGGGGRERVHEEDVHPLT